MFETSNPLPIYIQIADSMRQKILSGEWPEHYRLKGELILANEMGINRGTLRKAIQTLIAEGLLVSVQGRGTFVATKTLEENMTQGLISLAETLEQQGVPMETQVLDAGIQYPPLEVASLLSLSPGSKVFHMHRVRNTGSVRFVYESNYVNARFCTGIEKVDFTQNPLFKTIETHYNLELAWGRRTFQAQSANEEIAHHLQIPINTAVLYVQQITYLRGDTPIECSDIWMRGDKIRFSAFVSRLADKTKSDQSWTYTMDLPNG